MLRFGLRAIRVIVTRATGVVVEPGATEHGQLVELRVDHRAAHHDLPLREEVGAAAAPRVPDDERAHELDVADRAKREPAVVEQMAQDLHVAGAAPARAEIDPRRRDLAVGDPDRRGPRRRPPRSRRRESPAGSRRRALARSSASRSAFRRSVMSASPFARYRPDPSLQRRRRSRRPSGARARTSSPTPPCC